MKTRIEARVRFGLILKQGEKSCAGRDSESKCPFFPGLNVCLTPPMRTPENGSMSEWVKILVSALGGVATGVLLEPLKHFIQLRIKARRINADIYKELARLYVTLTLQAERTEDAEIVKTYFDILDDSDFEYYYSHEREAFNRLGDRRDIRAFYRLFERARETVLDGNINPIAAARMLIEDLQKRLRAGGLDKNLIDKYAGRYVKSLDDRAKKTLAVSG